MFYSRTDLDRFKPYTFSISDVYGETIDISKFHVAGDVSAVEVREYGDDGEPSLVAVTGNFHQDNRDNLMAFLQRLKAMKEVSEQYHQYLIFICPGPLIQMRGRIESLTGPNWTALPHPIIYEYQFEFRRAEQPRQAQVFSSIADVVAVEGKNYVQFTIPSADYTNVRDLAYAWYGEELTDNQKIREILALNGLTISDARHLNIGQVLKLPTS